MKRAIVSKWMYALVLAPVVAGCGGDAGEDGGDSQDIVVGVQDLSNSVTVETDQLTFDNGVYEQLKAAGVIKTLDAYAAASDKKNVEPVFLVGNRRKDAVNSDGSVKEDSRNPFGYLRRALSYTHDPNGKLVVKTAPASIDEAGAELEKNGFLTVSATKSVNPLDDKVPVGSQDADVKTGIWDRKWDENFGGEKKFDSRNIKVKLPVFNSKNGPNETKTTTLAESPILEFKNDMGSGALRLKSAFISITPRFNGEVHIKGLTTNSGFAEISAKAHSEIELEAEVHGIIQPKASGTWHIVDLVGAVGGFPTTLKIDVDWSCSLDAQGEAKANIGGTADGEVKARADFTDFAITPSLPKPTYSFTKIGPSLTANATVVARCDLTPKLAMGVFDAVGPTADLNLWTQFDARANVQNLKGQVTAKARAGGELHFGGGLQPFGVKLLTINSKPINLFETTIFDKTFDFGQ